MLLNKTIVLVLIVLVSCTTQTNVLAQTNESTKIREPVDKSPYDSGKTAFPVVNSSSNVILPNAAVVRDVENVTSISIKNTSNKTLSTFLIKVADGNITLQNVLSKSHANWIGHSVSDKVVILSSIQGLKPTEGITIIAKWGNKSDVIDMRIPIVIDVSKKGDLAENIEKSNQAPLQIIGFSFLAQAKADLNQNHLKIATFNVQLFSKMMCALEQIKDNIGPAPAEFLLGQLTQLNFAGDCQVEERANQVADRIISNENSGLHYELLAINEAWDEDGKEILVDKLKSIFPHYISYIGSGDIYDLEDSGLMLFSKLPFTELPYRPIYVDNATGEQFFKYAGDTEGSADVNEKTVAFGEYRKCSGADCIASKGVALVRVEKISRTYTIVFTHTQADYPSENYAAVRDNQFSTIQELISETLTNKPSSQISSMELQRHDIFIIGDLNVQYTSNQEIPPDICKKTSSEWKKRFTPVGSQFYGSLVRDVWFYTSSCDDSGFSSEFGTEARLDYILYNDYKNTFSGIGSHLCVQHIKLDFKGISDHNGLVADLNAPAALCSPDDAWEDPHLTLNKPTNFQYVSDIPDHWLHEDINNDPLEIKHPGSVQWFKINEKGTYSFATSQKDLNQNWVDNILGLEVYASTDLTNPLGSYKLEVKKTEVCENDQNAAELARKAECRIVEAKTWVIPEAPFYIKIFDPTESWTGQYKLLVDKHMCSSPEDSCLLLPWDEPYDPQLIDDKPLNAEDKAWFKVITERAHSEKPQSILFYVKKDTNTDDQLHVELLHENLTSIAEESGDEGLGQYAHAYVIDYKDLENVDANVDKNLFIGPNKFFVTVKRPVPILSGGSIFSDFSAGWRTNLLFFHGEQGGLSGTDPSGNKITPFFLKVADETNPEVGADDVILCFEWPPDNVISVEFVPTLCPYYDIPFDEGHGEGFDHLLSPIAFVDKLEFILCDADNGFAGDDDCTYRSIGPLNIYESRQWNKYLEVSFEDGIWVVHYNLSHSLMN